MRTSRKNASLIHAGLTNDIVVDTVLNDPKFANYAFLCLVKHPPYSRVSRRTKRSKSQGQRLRELVLTKLAERIWPHIDWAYLSTFIVRQEAMRRYVNRRYPVLRRRK